MRAFKEEKETISHRSQQQSTGAIALASIASSDKYPTFREKRPLNKTVQDHTFKQREASPEQVYKSNLSPEPSKRQFAGNRHKKERTRNDQHYQSGDRVEIPNKLSINRFGQT